MNKLLVTTGYPLGRQASQVEVIDLDNPSKTCILSTNFPYEVFAAVGGFTSSGPMICSGNYRGNYEIGDCYSLRKNGQFVKISTMNTPRTTASSIVTKDGNLMISGGYERKYFGTLTDTEIINVRESKIEAGFVLPKGISSHCSVLINGTTAMVLGGYNEESATKKSTYFINLETLQVTAGPEMQEARAQFGCAVFEHNQQNVVIVAGGTNATGTWSTNSTELLHVGSTQLKWSRGKANQVLNQ